ncbi:MAG TPA: hypothetical protein PLN25_08280 [Deltaproteobacteria bacterium]|nr:hypothetical protein [Deltaproteobacteria bacterium]HQB39026.1 hypothetical protein [Deltaproteobacteria bacterium]
MATINDIVLVNVDNKPGFYARIEDISPDVKPGWWQVKLLALTFPLQVFTWILDEYQIEGADFTMGGTPLRLDPVVSPAEEQQVLKESKANSDAPGSAAENTSTKVVSLAERRNRK